MKSSKLLDDLAIFVVISNLKTAMKVSAGKYVKASLFLKKKTTLYLHFETGRSQLFTAWN